MPGRTPAAPRFTVDASVIVNAFQPAEPGRSESFRLLDAIQAAGVPMFLPTLAVVEIASALARAGVDGKIAVRHVEALANLPHVTLVPLNALLAAQAAKMAAIHRLRGADAVYVAVAWRFGAVLVTRDQQQRSRSAPVIVCSSPGEALADLQAHGLAGS